MLLIFNVTGYSFFFLEWGQKTLKGQEQQIRLLSSLIWLSTLHAVCSVPPFAVFSLSVGHAQHLLGFANFDTMLRMTAEWECARLMADETFKYCVGQSKPLRLLLRMDWSGGSTLLLISEISLSFCIDSFESMQEIRKPWLSFFFIVVLVCKVILLFFLLKKDFQFGTVKINLWLTDLKKQRRENKAWAWLLLKGSLIQLGWYRELECNLHSLEYRECKLTPC